MCNATTLHACSTHHVKYTILHLYNTRSHPQHPITPNTPLILKGIRKIKSRYIRISGLHLLQIYFVGLCRIYVCAMHDHVTYHQTPQTYTILHLYMYNTPHATTIKHTYTFSTTPQPSYIDPRKHIVSCASYRGNACMTKLHITNDDSAPWFSSTTMGVIPQDGVCRGVLNRPS